MLHHSMSICNWPLSLLRDPEKAVRKFIWCGDIVNNKLVAVAWSNTCQPSSEGGLGIRSLSRLNAGFNLKLAWDLLHSTISWASLFRSRVMCKNNYIKHYAFSSIWSSAKQELATVLENSSWCIGNGKSVS
ncbi:unnamed protein product [Lathyrus sativus]|nr:unnamed protein product [Lathyrus sativus]